MILDLKEKSTPIAQNIIKAVGLTRDMLEKIISNNNYFLTQRVKP